MLQKLLILSLTLCISGYSAADPPSSNNVQIVEFDLQQGLIDFGNIPIGQEEVKSIRVKNISKSPITLTEARSSFGPFRLERNFKGLQPGESGELKVVVSGKRFIGPRKSAITLFFGAPNNHSIVLMAKTNISSPTETAD